MIKDFPDDQVKPMLASYCPNLLYPYAREAVTDLVVKGGFPQLYLTPVNFDSLYEQQLQQEAEGGEGGTSGEGDAKKGDGDTTIH